MLETKVDLVFQIKGTNLPVDNGYALHSVVSKAVTGFHTIDGFMLSPIRGWYQGEGILDLRPKSELTLRTPIGRLAPYINSEVIGGLGLGDYPGVEFFIGGKIRKDMDEKMSTALKTRGVTLEHSSQRLLELAGNNCFSSEGKIGNSIAAGKAA